MALPPGGVVLERTYFYPTGGGQPSDRGRLTLPGAAPGSGLEVVDVSKAGVSVLHRTRGSAPGRTPLQVGDEVDGTIDWERRHRHMRLHTGQHYLSARVYALTGLRTRRAALKGEMASLDLDGPLAPSVRPFLREELGDLVSHPRRVRVHHVSREEWERAPSGRSGLVPLPPHVDPIRVIEIEGVDDCPCGGTHVRSTDEVGPVELLPARPSGPDDRIEFKLTSG